MHQILISIFTDITEQPLTGIRFEKGVTWPKRWGFLDTVDYKGLYLTSRRVDTSYNALVSVRV